MPLGPVTGPYRPPLPASPADGQIPAWNAASQSWVASNPTGNAELAYAENISGTAQTGIVSATDITGCSIAVPASTRPVYLTAEVVVQFTALGTGTIGAFLQLVEVSNGVDSPVTWEALAEQPSATGRYASIVLAAKRLTSSTARTRTFKLQMLTDGATVTVVNGASYPSWIAAEAR